MEFALNLIWAAIAASAITYAMTRRHRVVATIAMLCALALLFPVISMSDDLQATVAALEDQVTFLPSAIVVIERPLTLKFVELPRASSSPSILVVVAFALTRRGPPSIGC